MLKLVSARLPKKPLLPLPASSRRSSMAEQLFCKQLVGGSIPFAGSNCSTDLRRLQPFNVPSAVFEGRRDSAPTPIGLSVNSMSLKWRAALLFGGQLVLVLGGVVALLFIQQAQQAAVASTDAARRAQVRRRSTGPG